MDRLAELPRNRHCVGTSIKKARASSDAVAPPRRLIGREIELSGLTGERSLSSNVTQGFTEGRSIVRRWLMLVTVSLLIAVAVFRWSSSSTGKLSDSDANTVTDLGPAKLRLISGTLLEGGKAEPHQHVQFRLPFVNVGDEPIDLSRFRQCAVCCQGGKLVATSGMVPPNEKGELLFDVEASERPGQNAVQAVIEYVPTEPYPDSEILPNVRLRLNYELHSHGLCEWELRDLDLGEVAVTGSWQREFVLTEQLHEKGEPTLEVSCESEAVEVRVVSQKPEHGVYDIPAMNFAVECRVDPKKLGLGRQTAMVVAKTPLGERLLRLRWHALPEYRFLPNPCVLFLSVFQHHQSLTYCCQCH